MKLHTTLPLLLCTASVSFATTIASFDGGADTPWTAGGNVPANIPAIASGQGVGGSDAMQLAYAGIGGNTTTLGFNLADPGAQMSVPFSFQFRVNAPISPSADGFSFSLMPTSAVGTSGLVPYLGEDPGMAGTVAFGFDTWGNGGVDLPFGPGGNTDYNDVSIWFNGTQYGVIDPRTLGVTLDNDTWHTATGNVNLVTGAASIALDGISMLNVVLPGIAPYEYRVGFGARTGGENENVYLDNLIIPEPASISLAGLGLLILGRRRRK